jgi:hypothetical protein
MKFNRLILLSLVLLIITSLFVYGYKEVSIPPSANIGGSSSFVFLNYFNQYLNTTSNVTFNNVYASNLCYSDGTNCTGGTSQPITNKTIIEQVTCNEGCTEVIDYEYIY